MTVLSARIVRADWLGPMGPLAVVLATIAYHYWWSFKTSQPPSVV